MITVIIVNHGTQLHVYDNFGIIIIIIPMIHGVLHTGDWLVVMKLS